MSGGSYNYIYQNLAQECCGRMYDDEMNDLIEDLCKVLHDLEWWESCDMLEEDYRKTLFEFKEKWFHDGRETRLKGYIDKRIGVVKAELYKMIGQTKEMPMPEYLWEQGQDNCVNKDIRCRTRPCTAAQDVFCCKECDQRKNCASRCKMGGAYET